MGVEIYPGFPAASLIEEDGVIKGVVTGDMGVAKDGSQKDMYQPGMELRAKYTLFAEGARAASPNSLSAASISMRAASRKSMASA